MYGILTENIRSDSIWCILQAQTQAQDTVVTMEKYITLCIGGLNALKNRLPTMADAFFDNVIREGAYVITYDNRRFEFSRTTLSSTSAVTRMGFELNLRGWSGPPGDSSHCLTMWVHNPQSSNATNKKALTACVDDLIANVRNGKVMSTRDAKDYL